MNLSEQDKELSQKVSQQEKKVDRLSSEVNSLQEKSRVLGILDDDVAENRKNVYIID